MGIKTIIVDIDGTLANVEHRRQYVASKPKNREKFHEGMVLDKLDEDIAALVESLWYRPSNPEFYIVLASGRSEDHRIITADCLAKQRIYPASTYPLGARFAYEHLYTRKSGDFRPDDIVKREILDQIREDGFEPYMAIDDRDRVVAMWRSNGIRALQVDNL
jgi:hypothetical protein